VDRQLAVAKNQDLDLSTWGAMKEQAAMLVKSGFLPPAINTPEKAIALMLKGRELGVPAMYALSNIHIINGKPVCSAELMLALVQRDHGHDAIRVATTDNTKCVVEYRQWGKVATYAFTIKDAEIAGLTQKGGNWKSYPAAMLRARAISAVCRMAFPASIAGMYTPDELGGDVVVHDNVPYNRYEQPESLDDYVPDHALVGVDQDGSPIIEADVRVVEHDNIEVDPETGEIIPPDVAPPSDLLTPKQLKMIEDIAGQHGFDNKRMDGWVKQLYGAPTVNQLSKSDASNLIDRLKLLKAG